MTSRLMIIAFVCVAGAGADLGLPSPGSTTLADQVGTFNVESFFDISYEIEFFGCPGSVFDGHAGTSVSSSVFLLGEHVVPDENTSWGSVKAMYGN